MTKNEQIDMINSLHTAEAMIQRAWWIIRTMKKDKDLEQIASDFENHLIAISAKIEFVLKARADYWSRLMPDVINVAPVPYVSQNLDAWERSPYTNSGPLENIPIDEVCRVVYDRIRSGDKPSKQYLDLPAFMERMGFKKPDDNEKPMIISPETAKEKTGDSK